MSQALGLREILVNLRPVGVRSTIKVVVKYVNLGWTNDLAKAPYEDGSDSKG